MFMSILSDVNKFYLISIKTLFYQVQKFSGYALEFLNLIKHCCSCFKHYINVLIINIHKHYINAKLL